MPLIIMCGYPCSGKSTIALALAEQLRALETPLEVVVIPEPIMNIGASGEDPRAAIYADSVQERELRGKHKSEVERVLSGAHGTDTRPVIVIMDAGNYIKGYRYELYCLAKSLKHHYAVVFCNTSPEIAEKWNAKIQRYPIDLLHNMIDRLEIPKSGQRWDNPLLTVEPSVWSSVDHIDVTSVVSELQQTMLSLKHQSIMPNRSTQLAPFIPTNFLQELDRTTQTIVDHILQTQAMGAQSVSLPPTFSINTPGVETVRISLMDRPTRFTLPELTRIKRRYITLQKSYLADATSSKTLPDTKNIAIGFMNYIRCCNN